MSSSDYTSNGNGDRSAAEIEREVERNRARLMNTAEELKERVSPSQLADQAVEWLRGSGGREFVGNMGATVRDNPLPVLMIGAGIAWLAFGGRSEAAGRSRYASSSYDDLSDTRMPYAASGEYAPGLTEGTSSGGSYAGSRYAGGTSGGSSGPGIGERISETASDLKERAGDLAARAGETASEAWERAKASAQSLAGSVTGSARGATDRVSRYGSVPGEYGYRTRRSVEEVFESQPLLIGAVGLAIGAALGAMLPSTETEDRLLGEQRDRIADRLQGAAGEVYGQAREQLGEAYERGKERLSESGLTPSRGAAVVGEVARELREAVERTAEEVAGAARSGTDRDPGTPGGRPGGAA